MVNHIARFYLPLSTDKPNKDADEDQILRVTHIITPDTHFGEYAAACKAGVHVVTSQWVERSTKSGWQYVERYFSPEAQNIFSGMVVAYSKASRLGKLVGTFVWLYQAYLSERIVPPTKRLLHYPVPTTPVPGMEHMVITVSHYTGASREYLRRLIIAMGAQYTPKMTRANTHLITAAQEGRKYTTAIDWNIDVVNHFWVEQCYQRWKLLSVSHPTFTYFPELPMLNSMVGE
ncbi:BRCT domain-containing protein, partial [Martensiomyces pterosporus]